MARPRVKTEEQLKENNHKLYEKRRDNEELKAKDAAKKKEYLATVTQIKLTLPKAQGEQLKKYCEEKGIKAQKLITQFLLDQGIITPVEDAAPAPEEESEQENN